MRNSKALSILLVSTILLVSVSQHAARADMRSAVSQTPSDQVRPVIPDDSSAPLREDNERSEQFLRPQPGLVDPPRVEPIDPSLPSDTWIRGPQGGVQIPWCRIFPWCEEVDPNSQRPMDLQITPVPQEPIPEVRPQIAPIPQEPIPEVHPQITP